MVKSQSILALFLVTLVSVVVSTQSYAVPPAEAPIQIPSPDPKPHPHPYPHRRPPPRVAVQGVVYCQSCIIPGVTAPWGVPIKGAEVKLVCKNKYEQMAKTDKNGFYFIQATEKLPVAWVRTCKVKLISSPVRACSKPTTLHFGNTGGFLTPEVLKKSLFINHIEFLLFSVKIFSFKPAYCKPY